MINPKTILAEWVTALQALPNLVEALGGNASYDSVLLGEHDGLRPTHAGERSSGGSRDAAGIDHGRVARHAPGRLGNALVFVHDFSLYLRAPETGSIGYEDLFNWIVNDIPEGGTLKMLHLQVDPSCEPMDFYLPSARRNTIVISADGATFEYFEVAARLIESYNP